MSIIQKSASLHNTLATTGMLYELFCLRGRRLLRLREITFCLGNMYPVHSIWTKDGKDMVFDLQNKPTEYFFYFSQNPRWWPSIKSPKSTKFDPTNHISAWNLYTVHPIWTKFGLDILLGPSNKPAQKISHLSQNPGWRRLPL